MALRHIRNSTKSNNHTNIILVSAPHGCDLMQPPCVNNEIRSFNRNPMKSARAYQHVSILEMDSDRKLFTNHGLHLNGLGKLVLSKQIVSHVYAMVDQKKDLPIILSWNSDLGYTDTLCGGTHFVAVLPPSNSPPDSTATLSLSLFPNLHSL